MTVKKLNILVKKSKPKKKLGEIGKKIVKHLLFLKNHNLSVEDLKPGEILFMNPYKYNHTKDLFFAIKNGNFKICNNLLEENRLLLFDIDHVKTKSNLGWKNCSPLGCSPLQI